MKTIFCAIFVFAVFARNNATDINPDQLVDQIKDAIERVSAAIRDPLEVKDKDIVIPTNAIENGELDIIEASISGLSNIEIKSLTYDSETFRLDFSLNTAIIDANILTNLDLAGLVNIKNHELSVKVTFADFAVSGYAVVAEDLKSVSDFSVLNNFGDIKVEVEGLLENEELSQKVSEYLSENSAKILNSVATLLSHSASAVIKDVINFVLRIVE